MVDQFSSDQLVELKKTFSLYDKNGDGTINTNELGAVMCSQRQNLTEKELQKLLTKVDADGSGRVDFPEFLTIMARSIKESTMHKDILEAFQSADTDGNGLISASEIRQLMETFNYKMTYEEVHEMIGQFDTDGDGKINYAEFANRM